ncbi:MAG: hypothetical protein ACRDI2_13980 [Chloroflexota bacterium]
MRIIEYLFMPPGEVGPVFSRWGGVLFGAFLALTIGIVVLGSVMHILNARHGLKRRITQRTLWWGVGLQVLGLVLLGLRLVSWPILSMRIWLYAHLIAEVGAAGYLLWWMQNRYPGLLAVYEWEEKKRAYLPRAAGGEVEPARRRVAARRRR